MKIAFNRRRMSATSSGSSSAILTRSSTALSRTLRLERSHRAIIVRRRTPASRRAGSAGLRRLRLQLLDRPAGFAPGFESALDMRDRREAHALRGLRRQGRAPAAGTEEDKALVLGKDRLVVRALRIDPKLQHAARDM